MALRSVCAVNTVATVDIPRMGFTYPLHSLRGIDLEP